MGNSPICRSADACCCEEKTEVDFQLETQHSALSGTPPFQSYVKEGRPTGAQHGSNVKAPISTAPQVQSYNALDGGDGDEHTQLPQPESTHPPPYSHQDPVMHLPEPTTPVPDATNKDKQLKTAADWARDQSQFSHLPPLPDGWIRVKSRNSDEIYYHCIHTGETTFTEPVAAQGVLKSDDLPPGWVAMKSRNSGDTYYWNTVLEVAQFEKPTPSQATAKGNDNDGLPDGWVSMVSRTTGHTYYYNAERQVSQFDRPVA